MESLTEARTEKTVNMPGRNIHGTVRAKIDFELPD